MQIAGILILDIVRKECIGGSGNGQANTSN